MLLTFVLFYLIYIQVSHALPPLTHIKNDNQYSYNEKFLGTNLGQQNIYGLQNYPPARNIGAPLNYNVRSTTSPGNVEIINVKSERFGLQNPLKPQVNGIRSLPHNYDNLFNRNVKQERVLPQFRRDNLDEVQKMNLRGYVGPDLINPAQLSTLPQSFSSQIIGHQNTNTHTKTPNQVESNHPIFNPVLHDQLDIPSRNSKKSYTIVHPNGTVEETDDFEYIKKNYPNYIIHDLREAKKNIPETDVHAGSPMMKTIVPIHNVLPVQPLSNIKETLVPHTLQIAQSYNLAKIEEPKNIQKESAVPKPSISRSLTQIESSSPLYTNIQTVQSTEKTPILDKGVITHSDKGSETSEDKSSSLYEDDGNYMPEKINAADFWRQIDVIGISEAEPIESTPLEKLETQNDQFATNTTANPNKATTADSKISDSENADSVDDSYEVFNTNPDLVEDFVNSIQDRIEFIQPFLILNDTNEVTNDNFNSTEQVDEDASDEADGDLTKPIYIPHISKIEDDDTNSSFWFTTNDEKAWLKLAPQNKKNLIQR